MNAIIALINWSECALVRYKERLLNYSLS